MIVTFKFLTAAVRRVVGAFHHLGRFFGTMLLLSLAATWLVFAGVVYESYLNAWTSAGSFASSVKTLTSFDVARNLEFYNLSLQAAARGFADPEIWRLPTRVRQSALFDQAANASGFGSIMILDKDGRLLASSRSERPEPFDGSSRDYFQVYAAGKGAPDLYISHPFRGHRDGLWTVALSRRLANPDGSFAGVVVGTLKLSYFLNLFGTVRMPAGGVMILLHEDGTILMRSQLLEVGRNLQSSAVFRDMARLRSGEILRVSEVDHVERLYSFGIVDHLPIMLAVGLSTADFLTTWRWRMLFVALGFAVLTGFILLLAVALGRELHRRSQAESALLELAATDGMTGLANRRQFDQTLEAEWSRAQRTGTSVALLMIDNDFFKLYNDSYGHLQGDEALKAVATALRDTIRRPADLVARFGGEEFAILLPGTDLGGALEVAETVRAAVSRLGWAHAGSPFGRLTVSIGLAACQPEPGREALSLVQAADFALYEAKERGRNQVATGERLELPGFDWRASA